MAVESILIVDDNYESIHKACIELEGYDFRIVISDKVCDVLEFFQIREIPNVIFLSETIKDRIQLVRFVKSNTSIRIIPIYATQDGKNRKNPCICKPYCGNDFFEVIRELA